MCCELSSLMRRLEQIASRALNSLATNGNESIMPAQSGMNNFYAGHSFNIGVVVVIIAIVALLLQRSKKKTAGCPLPQS